MRTSKVTSLIGHSFLFLAILTSKTTLSAQYIPFLNQSQWYINTEGTLLSAFDYYTTGKDSLLGGHSWQQVLENNTTPTPAYVREESGNQRVYLSSSWDNWSERLLYDFKAQVNDTFPLGFRFQGVQRFVVGSIDSVNTTSGFVSRINLQNIDGSSPPTVQWTLGIGDEAHPFYLDYTGRSDTSYHLICSYQNRQKVFDDGFGHCPGIPPPLSRTGSTESPPEIHWDGTHFSLEVTGNGWQWQIADLLGHVQAGQLRHGANQINNSLPSGLLMVSVWKGNTRVGKKFWVRELAR